MPLDMFPRSVVAPSRVAAGTLPTTTQSLTPEAPQGTGIPLNPKAVDALRKLSVLPQFKTGISPEKQKQVQDILAGIGPDNRLYKYGAQSGPGDIGLAPWLNKKLNPFVPDEQFAPGEQSIYGDIFSRQGAGVRKGIRALRERDAPYRAEVDRITAEIDTEYKETPDYAGKDSDYILKRQRAFEGLKERFEERLAAEGKPGKFKTFIEPYQEGVTYPRSVEPFQTERIEDYYSRPEVGSAMEQGGLAKAGAITKGMGVSALGLGEDILTNPADLALMFTPVPKSLQRLGGVKVGKGFLKGVKGALRPGAAATKAGVSAGEQAIKANLGKAKAVAPLADDAAKIAKAKIDAAVKQVNASKAAPAAKDVALKKIQALKKGAVEPVVKESPAQMKFKFKKPKVAKKNIIEKAAVKETPGQTVERMFPELAKGKKPDITKGAAVKKPVSTKKISALKKKLKETRGSKKIGDEGDSAADDLVKAFKNALPEIIDDVKKTGGTVMERIKAMTDDAGKPLASKEVLAMVEKEVGESAVAAKAEITRHGNWNLKNLNAKVRQGVLDMAKANKNLTKKGKTVTDAQVKKMADNLTGTPTLRAILKTKPGTLAAETRKVMDDAVSSLKSVLDEDLGKKGLHKKLMKVVEKRFKKWKNASGEEARALRQSGLTADDNAKIKGIFSDIIKKYREDPLMHPDDFKVIHDDLIKVQNNIINSTNLEAFMDKAYYTWLNGLLSNPFTHGVNFTSNAAFLLEKFPNRFFDVLGDATVRGFARTQGVKLDPAFRLKEIPAMFRGFNKFLSRRAQGKKPWFKIKKGTKLDQDIPSPLSENWERVIGLPVRTLKNKYFGDDAFKEAIGYMEYYSRHVAGERGATLESSVAQEQLLRTFQDEASALGKFFMFGKKTVPGLKFTIPFVNTPDRILLRTLERTVPGSVTKLGIRLNRGAPQKEISHAVGLVYQSILLHVAVTQLWKNSAIHGDAPDNEAERIAFYESGKKANAIKIGGFWVPFNRIEPLGGALSIVTNFIQDYANSDQEKVHEKFFEAIGGTLGSLSNKTYYQGALGMMRAATDAHIYGGKWVGKMVASGVPASGLQRFFAQFIDPVYRSPDNVTEKVMSGVPWLSKKVPPSLGAFGEEQIRTPLGIGKEKTDKLTVALKDTPIPTTSKTIVGEKMTTREYNNILIKSGPFLKQALTELTSAPGWKNNPRGIRQMAVNDTTKQIRGMYRSELKMQKIYQQIKDEGVEGYMKKFTE